MTDLTLMTWNVRYFGHGLNGLRATEGWIRLAARTLAHLPAVPDVIALQEVETLSLRGGFGQSQLERFEAHLHRGLCERGIEDRYIGLHFPAHRYGLGGKLSLYTTGLAVLVRDTFQIEQHNALDPHEITHIPPSRFAFLKQRRIAAHLRLRAPGGPSVDLFNTHLSLPAFWEVGPHRVPDRMGHGSNQLREIDRLMELIEAQAGEHAVLLGDFNTAPGSPAYERLVSGRLVDVHAAYGDDHPTHHSALFMHKRMHIDHIFATPQVQWHAFDAHGVDDASHPFYGLSDHAPKIGRLVIP